MGEVDLARGSAPLDESAGLEAELEQRKGEGELGRDLGLPAATSRSRWVIRSSRVEVPPLSFFSSLATVRSNSPTASRALASWSASRPTASSAAGTSAPI